MINISNCKVDAYEDQWEIGNDGKILKTPFQNFYYSPPGREITTFGCLTFAGHNLANSTILFNTKVFCLEFSGEHTDCRDRESWANPIRGNILKKLLGTNESWYLSFVSDITDRIIQNDNRQVPEELFRYFNEMDKSRVTTVMSEKPYGAGYGYEKKMFFEIPKQEIEWVAQNIWPDVKEIYPIEGYILPSGDIDLIRKWDQKKRDYKLFKEVLKKSKIMFYTYPAEHRHFKFLTTKMDFNEFIQNVDLQSFHKEAKEIEKRLLVSRGSSVPEPTNNKPI